MTPEQMQRYDPMSRSDLISECERLRKPLAGDLMQLTKDQLFDALRLAIPSASHNELVALVKAIESFTSAKALEVMSL
jgi:hypothetical protein